MNENQNEPVLPKTEQEETDANGMLKEAKKFFGIGGQKNETGSGLSRPAHKAHMVVEKDQLFYKFDHKRRGTAVIFNHEIFDVQHLGKRNGTNADRDNLESCLRRLGFDVIIHNNLTAEGVMDEVEKCAYMDHSDSDCFFMCVLSHGEEGGIIFAKDVAYKQERLWMPFTADKCKSLAGKPKLIFIQACQGSQLDPGIRMTQTDSSPSYRIPVHADFLIAYSTFPGFYSWRNTTKGSWFIQALCSELKENGSNFDILTLLTFVNRRVAVDFESYVPNNYKMHGQKQIPCITFMLTRLLKFPPKSIS